MIFSLQLFYFTGVRGRKNEEKKQILTVAIVVVCFAVILATVFIVSARKNETGLQDMKADLIDVGLGDDEDVIESTDEEEKPKEDDTEREVPENDNSVEIQEENIVDDDTDINSIPSSTIVNKDIPIDITPDLETIYKGDSMELDTDEDGILDGEETLWRLDYKKEDSDGDGLTDFVELNITLTDPLNIDTDGDGITDALADIEGDGIDNQTELFYNTNPLSSDTDGDNLTDYEEIFTYGTDALNADCDSDGLCDYDDVFLGFSPLLADTDANGVLDPDEKVMQEVEEIFKEEGRGVTKVSVSINVSGNAQTDVSISNVYGIDMMSSDVVGLVGVPVEICTPKEFEAAEIAFYYDENQLGNTSEESLSILWYDEENNWYQILDNDCIVDAENNKVSYVTTHFSTYMLVDSKAWYDAWRENIDYRSSVEGDEKHYFDIVFTVDCSDSMYNNNKMKMTVKALKNFVNSMQDEDEAAIVRFNGSAEKVCDFTNDTTVLEEKIDRLSLEGGTNVDRALLKTLELFEDRENEKQKVVVLICDGEVNYIQSTIDLYIEQNIKIYAINLMGFLQYDLMRVAQQTGGLYYYVESAEEIEVKFATVQDETINQIDTTDVDGDGLYDVYETAGMVLPNGKLAYTDATKADTDGDGLSDYEEAGIIFNVDDRYIGLGYNRNVKYFMIKSDPTQADTDSDGIGDRLDEFPWRFDLKCVAKLSNKFSNVQYLKIDDKDGGDQGWWEEEANSDAKLNHFDFITDKNYRIWKMGCGLIAVSDVEIYFTQQNGDYSAPINGIAYDKETGIIQRSNYMSYVNLNADMVYNFSGDVLRYYTGLLPISMELGLEQYLAYNDYEQTSVTWAPYCGFAQGEESFLVLDEIKKMLNKDLPVVFAYYTTDEDNRIMIYSKPEYAQWKDMESDENKQPVESHYMTIIGLYKYWDEEIKRFEYILEVVSWGDVYYIRYDEYSDNISYFSNILTIN